MTANDESDRWYVDSGATSHMTNSENHLSNARGALSNRSITVADNSKISVKSTGDALKCVKTLEGENKIIIRNCQYVPDLCTNLLSVLQKVQNDHTVVFKKTGCIIYNANGKVVATADLINNMSKLNVVSLENAFSAKSADNIMLFHSRMGHLSLSGMQRLKNIADIDTTAITKCSGINCVVCAEGKHCRGKFDKTEHKRANDFLEPV